MEDKKQEAERAAALERVKAEAEARRELAREEVGRVAAASKDRPKGR
jgi:hypothetical protein